MSLYGDLHRKIRLKQDITEKGSGITHDIPLTFEEMAYILGSMQVSHSLNMAIKEGSEDAQNWMTSKDNKRYREDGTVIPPYNAPDQCDQEGRGMKKAFTIYVPADCHLLAICGGIAVEKDDKSEKSVNFSNFSAEALAESPAWLFKIEGEAEAVEDEV